MTHFEDKFSEEIWDKTYKYHKDESIDDTLMRVAKGASQPEADQPYWEGQFYELLSNFKFSPAGRITSNCGTEFKGTTMMNCFSAPRDKNNLDSIHGILRNLRNQTLTLKSEGGWGDNFSYIRPRGSYIKGIGAESPGAVQFMELFNSTSDVITSGSGTDLKNSKGKKKIRKGAMMGVMDVWHPDVMEFITAKQTAGKLSKFNMSVNCSDEFMRRVVALHDDTVVRSADEIRELDTWHLIFPDTDHPAYNTTWDGNIKEWIEVHKSTLSLYTVQQPF